MLHDMGVAGNAVMSFEFFTPEGVSVRCETVEELVDSYTALWRNHEHTATIPSPPLPQENQEEIAARNLQPLPSLDEVWNDDSKDLEDPTIMMPKNWAAIWSDILRYGERGTSIASVSLRIGRVRNTVWSTANLMQSAGFIEKSDQRGLWRVPVNYRHHKLVISRAIAVKG